MYCQDTTTIFFYRFWLQLPVLSIGWVIRPVSLSLFPPLSYSYTNTHSCTHATLVRCLGLTQTVWVSDQKCQLKHCFCSWKFRLLCSEHRDETASRNICRAEGDKTGAIGFVLRTVWQLSQVHMHMQTMLSKVLHPAISNFLCFVYAFVLASDTCLVWGTFFFFPSEIVYPPYQLTQMKGHCYTC